MLLFLYGFEYKVEINILLSKVKEVLGLKYGLKVIYIVIFYFVNLVIIVLEILIFVDSNNFRVVFGYL